MNRGTFDYYNTARQEIAPLLPQSAERVLEIGCGAGGTLRWLRQRWPNAWLAGADINPKQVELARDCANHVEQCDLDARVPAIPEESIDLLLCLDVLEHLRDPWSTLSRLHRLVKPQGCCIISTPNVRHASVVLPLLFAARWRYQGSGIMDRTHLRFFTRSSACDLAREAGFRIDTVLGLGTEAGKRGHYWNVFTLGLFRDLLTRQYVIRATRPASS